MMKPCVVCGGGRSAPFLELAGLPVVCNRLCSTRQEATAVERGQLQLVFCEDCGHVFNAAFDERLVEYAPGYENSLAFSDAFRAYAQELVEDLVRRHALRDARVVEIGCGRAELLAMLVERAGGHGFGFDPSASEAHPAPGVTVTRALFDEQADIGADLVLCRHCLEHVAQPLELLSALKATLADGPSVPVFFEVPNLLYTLRDGGIWDLIYEHCGYFSSASLTRAFEMAGFEVEAARPAFGGQFVTLHAWSGACPESVYPQSVSPAADTVTEIGRQVAGFATRFREKVSLWQSRVQQAARTGRRIAVWGAGSKGATFLNLVDPEGGAVDRVIDQNPRKHGAFVAGTGHPITSPLALREHPADLLVVMNPTYLGEIRAAVSELGLDMELCVG